MLTIDDKQSRTLRISSIGGCGIDTAEDSSRKSNLFYYIKSNNSKRPHMCTVEEDTSAVTFRGIELDYFADYAIEIIRKPSDSVWCCAAAAR